MERLMRTQVDRFSICEAYRLSEIEELVKEGRIGNILTGIEEMFSELPEVSCEISDDRILYNGNPLTLDRAVYGERVPVSDGQQVRMYDSRHVFIGIFKFELDRNRLKPVKMFYQA